MHCLGSFLDGTVPKEWIIEGAPSVALLVDNCHCFGFGSRSLTNSALYEGRLRVGSLNAELNETKKTSAIVFNDKRYFVIGNRTRDK